MRINRHCKQGLWRGSKIQPACPETICFFIASSFVGTALFSILTTMSDAPPPPFRQIVYPSDLQLPPIHHLDLPWCWLPVQV